MSINQISILMLVPPMLLAALIIFGVLSYFLRAFVIGLFKGVGEHRATPGQKLSTSAKAVPRELAVAGARMSREFRSVTAHVARVSMEFRVPRPNRPSIVNPSVVPPRPASPSIVAAHPTAERPSTAANPANPGKANPLIVSI